MPIKCVFFDFDDVLRSWEYQLDGIEENFGIPLQVFRDVAFAPENLDAAITGVITDEEWRTGVCSILVARFPELDARGAWDTWSSRTGELIPETLEVIHECKSKVPIGMISNATSRLPRDLKYHGIFELFNYVINTSEIGITKPNPEVYVHATSVAGVEPHEAFFTDDKAENVDAAVKLGWSGHVFKNADGLRAALIEAEVL